METYAVVATGGKQYLVQAKDKLKVEKLTAEAGSTVSLDSVLAISDGQKLTVGSPLVKGASVTVKVLDTAPGEKVVSFKKKRRKGYHRKRGHRQILTTVEVEAIQGA